MNTKRSVFPLLILLATILTGCGSDYLSIYVESDPKTNDERPFYLLVRSVDDKSYREESYKQIVEKMVVDPEKTVLKSQLIYPGKELSVEIEFPEGAREKSLAVYFLFTDPGSNWKSLFTPPLPDSLEYVLKDNRIESAE